VTTWTPYTLLPFGTLVDQVWGLLNGSLWVVFPTSDRAHPSRCVLVQPVGFEWPGAFWQEVVVPTMTTLLETPPTIPSGWANPMTRTVVEGRLRRALSGTSWESWVDFSR
jgi:hypothetical protein